MKRLVLFDIDETMVKPHGVGGRALLRAFADIVGRQVTIDGIKRSGRTDPAICLDIMVVNNIALDQFDNVWQQINTIYPLYLEEEISKCPEYKLHKGVVEIIAALESHEGVFLGLLTGNTKVGAYIKLSTFQLNPHFPIGAFGCDNHDRLKLPAIAHKRAMEHYREDIKTFEVVIIGDAENDILCAQGFGAKSIVVNTGKTTWGELEVLKPDYLLPSLEDTGAVLQAVLS